MADLKLEGFSKENARQNFYEELVALQESYYYRWRSEGSILSEILLGMRTFTIHEVRRGLHSWWSRTRCAELLEQYLSGEKTIDEVRLELPTSERGKKDFETWLSWMLETPLLKSLSTS